MIDIYSKNNNDDLISQDKIANSWISLLDPSQEEINNIQKATEVPMDFLKAALDENEHSRIELEDDCILIIINIPLKLDRNKFDTLPLGIVISRDYFITVCLKENNVVEKFKNMQQVNELAERKTGFLCRILSRSAMLYLRYMRYINNMTDELEKELQRSTKNKTLFELFELERSLVYFITALKDNAIVMEKLLRLRKNPTYQPILDIHEDEEELLEDVIIENKQAIEMVEMHSNILSSMMDAFASIISNNLNIVMKFLTSVTIMLAIPTMISSFWGMNVDVPFRNHAGGFLSVAVIAIIATSSAGYLLWKKRMF